MTKKKKIPWNKGIKNEKCSNIAKKAWETRRINKTDKHSKETKDKLSKHRKIEWENGIRISHVAWNKGLTKETDERVKINAQNRKGITPKYSEKSDRDRRIKLRNSVIRNIEKYRGKLSAFVGKNETQLLNEQEIKDNCKIERQYYIKDLGYIVDGYCKETNTVYEVYENFHNNKVEKDLERQKAIEEKLNCSFIIINDNDEQEKLTKAMEQ